MKLAGHRLLGNALVCASVAVAATSAHADLPAGEPTLAAHDTITCITDHAWLRAELGGRGVAGRTVVFSLANKPIASQQSDAHGRVLAPYVVPEGSHIGANTVTVTVDGTSLRATANLDIVKTATKISWSSASQNATATSDTVWLSANLVRIDGTFLPGRTLRFALNGKTSTTLSPQVGAGCQTIFTLPADQFGKTAAYTVTFDGDANYLPTAASASFVVQTPPPPPPKAPPSWNYAFYPDAGPLVPIQLGQTRQYRTWVAYYPSKVAVANASIQIIAWGSNGSSGNVVWVVGKGTTDAKGLLTFNYTHEVPASPGTYTVIDQWVKDGLAFNPVDTNDSSFLQTPMIVGLTQIKVVASPPTAAVPVGGVAHITARVTRASDQKPASDPGVLWLYTEASPTSARLPGYGSIDGSGNGSFDLTITPDIKAGHHVFYLASIGVGGGPWASSDLVPVAFDVFDPLEWK